MTHNLPRTFAVRKHRRGEWDTHIEPHPSFLVWTAGNILSLKRAGVARCAALSIARPCVLDLGCGNGAYSLWFSRMRPRGLRVACDWAFPALRDMRRRFGPRLCGVCADVRALPFKNLVFDAIISVDVLGHVRESDMVVDEMARTTRSGVPLFIHCECNDYAKRWPYSALAQRGPLDPLDRQDGHIGLRGFRQWHELLKMRFKILRFAAPAGLLGWLLGYPEKHQPLFAMRGMRLTAAVTAITARLKKWPGAGMLLRLLNTVTNRIEIACGIQGGGSCFALMRSGQQEDPSPGARHG